MEDEELEEEVVEDEEDEEEEEEELDDRSPLDALENKVCIYTEYHSVCPLVGIGTLKTLSRKRRCPSSPEPKGEGHTRLRMRESQFRRLEKKLSTLPTLCPGIFFIIN